jgi:hypothetical protein
LELVFVAELTLVALEVVRPHVLQLVPLGPALGILDVEGRLA